MKSVRRRKIHFNFFIIICVVLTMVFSVTGCRQSPALTDNVYTKDATEVDPDQSTATENQLGEQDEFKTAEEEKQNIESDIKEQTAAVNQELSDRNQDSREVRGENESNTPSALNEDNKSESSVNGQTGGSDGNATKGSGNNSSPGGTGGNVSEDNGSGDSESEEKMNDPDADNDSQDVNTSGSSEENGDEPTYPEDSGGNGDSVPSKWDMPRKTVRDASNTEWNIPRDVYTVTAVGAAAPIVEMIGGSGRLMASSASFTQGALANTICQDVINGNVLTWWNGDGTDPISENNFQTLMAASPDVCFVVGDQTTFTTDQLVALQEAGIGYVPLPELNSIANMKSAVNIVAATLETNETTHERAADIAKEYSDWVDNIVNEVQDSPKMYTLFAAEWDGNIRGYINVDWEHDAYSDGSIDEYPGTFHFPGVRYNDTFYDDTGSYAHEEHEFWGGVIAWSRNMRSKEPLYELLQIANITETGMAGPFFQDRVWIRNNDCIVLISGLRATHIRNLEVDGINYPVSYANWDLTTATYYRDSNSGIGKLGMSVYPAIVTMDKQTADSIQQSPMWKYYNYNEFCAMFSDGVPRFGYDSFLASYDIVAPYNILVNPAGFDSWVYGGIDAPLESLWAAANISGTVSQEKLESEVLGFYKNFFGVEPPYSLIIQ